MRPPEAIEDERVMLREAKDDVLGWESPDFDEPAVGSEPFDLRVMIDAVAERFARPARTKGISLEVKTAAAVPAAAIGDVVRLRQVLISLIDNAVKFTERGEVVASVTADLTPGGRALLYAEVSDTGAGIPPETMARLFDASGGPRRAGAAAPAGDGGLPSARETVELMDGQLGCSSAVGMGTTAWFSVPLDLPAE